MHAGRRVIRASAAITLSLQLIATALVSIGACIDRPHMHGGIPTPECLMHHARTASGASGDTAMAGAHDAHAHHHGTPKSGTRIGCQCSPDALWYVVGPAADLTAPTAVPFTLITSSNRAFLPVAVPDVDLPPLSPPPRIAHS